MVQAEIFSELQVKHTSFIDYVNSLDETSFNFSHNEKWTAGQQLAHIDLSLKPLAKVLFFPKFILKRKFGRANRESKSYQALKEKYVMKLQGGGTANTAFRPEAIKVDQRKKIIEDIERSLERIYRRAGRYSEADLDFYILPHPLLGKLTIREMLYFTIYHVQHHEEITKRNLTEIMKLNSSV